MLECTRPDCGPALLSPRSHSVGERGLEPLVGGARREAPGSESHRAPLLTELSVLFTARCATSELLHVCHSSCDQPERSVLH